MWKKVKIADTELLLQHTVSGSTHRIYVTDFIHLWCEEINEGSLLLRCKEMNKLVEASDEVFLGHVLLLLDTENNDVSRGFSDSDANKVLNLQTVLEGLKFRIKFVLTQADNFQFYKEVTRPLLTVVSAMERRQQLLVDVVKSKDMEILEYKLEGGQISRKAVETEQFDLDAFSSKCVEELGVAKGCVATSPSHALTPFVQDMLERISAVSEQANKKSRESVKQNNSKTRLIKLNTSPAKRKKIKISKNLYEDNDDDDGAQNKDDNKSEEVVDRKEIKQEPDSPTKTRQPKAKPNSRLKKVLSDL